MNETTLIILAIVIGGIIGGIIDKKRKNKSKPKDINTIIDNDPVLQDIDKKIGKLNDIAFERLKEDENAMRILRRQGIIEQTYDVGTINKIKYEIYTRFQSLVDSGAIPINYYDEIKAEMETWGTLEQFENGETESAVSAEEWEDWGKGYIESGIKLGELIKEYGESVGEKIFLKEVWKGMTVEELIESRGEPDDIENIELVDDSHIIYSYGFKNTGSYFKIRGNIVVEYTDRMKKIDFLSNI